MTEKSIKLDKRVMIKNKVVRRTTAAAVELYEATAEIFKGLIAEIRELSKKKPDATLSKGKVRIVNRVLEDLKIVLSAEPEKKFLDVLDDEDLPQTSDAVLIMVQYETALAEFAKRYHHFLITKPKPGRRSDSLYVWVTEDFDPSEYENSTNL